MQSNDVKTEGYVLRRTNYGEADRILNIITPLGKISAIAKGVRKEKSKLAGGIEMFSLAKFNIHKGRSELGVVTSARMIKYFGEIVKDLGRMELAGAILKKISLVADSSDSPEYFKIVDQCLVGINAGLDLALVEAWFWLKLANAMGDEVNLYRDVDGVALLADKRYVWDVGNMAFIEKTNGDYGADEIKMLRLMLSSDLAIVQRVKTDGDLIARSLAVARAVGRV